MRSGNIGLGRAGAGQLVIDYRALCGSLVLNTNRRDRKQTSDNVCALRICIFLSVPHTITPRGPAMFTTAQYKIVASKATE